MYVRIWSTEGEDEGYLNLDTLDRFKLESTGDNPFSYNLIAKKDTVTKVWKIPGDSYVKIKDHMKQFPL